MKKEIFSVSVLIFLLIAVLFNTYFLNTFTGEIISTVNAAENDALHERWDLAAQKAQTAAKMWNKNEPYTHIVLDHNEIDIVHDSFCGFLEKIYSQDLDGITVSCDQLRYYLSGISRTESISIGNIL